MTVFRFTAKPLIRRYEFSPRSDSANAAKYCLKIYLVVQLLFSNKLLICSSVVINQN